MWFSAYADFPMMLTEIEKGQELTNMFNVHLPVQAPLPMNMAEPNGNCFGSRNTFLEVL